MYVNYYNLSKAPFHITPDPEFLFLSSSHKEALGAIIYCIAKKKGFVSIIGEVGTGKTTIVRSYLARCNRTQVKPIYVFNPAVTFTELLKTIFHELEVKPRNENLYDMVQQLHTVLISEYERDRNIVLIIDEAQNMPVPTFEQLRILSNLETPKDKLLQIILVGQPELAEKLAGKELRQLNQRLAIRATLRPLSPDESRDYVLFRLSKVTRTPKEIFSPGALKKIIKAAKGSPRMLNILCDNALVAGFGYQEKQITRAIAKQVIADFEGKAHPLTLTWKHASIFGALLLSVSALSGIHAFSPFTNFGFARNEHPAPESNQTQIEIETSRELPPATPQVEHEQNGVLSLGPFANSRTGTKVVTRASGEEHKTAGKEMENMPTAPGKKREGLGHSSASPGKIKAGSTIRTVKEGEHLSQICMDKYGFVDDQVIKVVKDNNPRIVDADLIYSGDRILLPELSTPDPRRADSHGRLQP
jgi:general secretion pathway protein A